MNVNYSTVGGPPPIPLEYPFVPPKLNKANSVSFKLRTNPEDANSMLHEIVVPMFAGGTASELFFFQDQLEKIFTGQLIVTPQGKFNMTLRLLEGDPHRVFKVKMEELPERTEENYVLCFNEVIKTVLPQRALAFQRRYMRKLVRKPFGMTTRNFIAWFLDTNDKLDRLPPFAPNQKMGLDEITEHAEFAVPKSWQTKMARQGFDPLEHTLPEFVAFCERLEFTETLSKPNNNNNKQGKNTKSNGQKAPTQKGGNQKGPTPGASTGGTKPTPFFCLLHGNNHTHNTNDCRVLTEQAKKMANAYKASDSRAQSRKVHWDNHNNKKKPPQGDLHAIINQAVARQLAGQKRPASDTMGESFQYEHLAVGDVTESTKETQYCMEVTEKPEDIDV